MKAEQRSYKRRPSHFIRRALILFFLGISVLAILIGVWITQNFSFHLPEIYFSEAGHGESPTFYYYSFEDRTNRIGSEVPLPEGMYAQRPRLQISYPEIPKELENAFLAIEDKRFYNHRGVDWYRTIGAGFNYVLGFSDHFGGSTVTQQLVKNLTGNNEVTWRRKLQEILYALDLERRLDKSEILAWYLNVIHFSDRCDGVAEAASHYYSKDVRELTAAQCASLAAIANSPARYHPVRHPDHNLQRRNLILSQMYEQGYLTEEAYLAAREEELGLSISASEADQEINSWYVDMVIEDVIQDLIREYGMSRTEASRRISFGGLQIYTAMDPEMQRIVEGNYRDQIQLPTNAKGESAQSGIILMDAKTGDILAVSGAIGEKRGNFLQSFATQTLRPPGSCLKPVSVFAPALEKGIINWASVYDDVPIRFSDSGRAWPKNATGIYRGLTTVSYAVAHSTNTVALRILEELGLEESFFTAKEKFHLPLVSVPGANDCDYAALALGQLNYGVTLRDMTTAYTAFADGGVYHPWRSYYRVLDAEGNLLLSNADRGEILLSDSTAAIMTKLLQGVVQEGTSSSVTLTGLTECAGKTGTTNNNADRWFIGYTPEWICGVWCGYAYPEPLIGKNLCSGIWNTVMTEILKGRTTKTTFDVPKNVIRASYCKDSGKRISEDCLLDPRGNREGIGWFVAENCPSSLCDRHVRCDYDLEHGGIAGADCPPENRTPTALIRVQRSFPKQIYVSDAQYTYGGDPMLLPPNTDLSKSYFAPFESSFSGISHTESPYNRSCPFCPLFSEEEGTEDSAEEESEKDPDAGTLD